LALNWLKSLKLEVSRHKLCSSSFNWKIEEFPSTWICLHFCNQYIFRFSNKLHKINEKFTWKGEFLQDLILTGNIEEFADKDSVFESAVKHIVACLTRPSFPMLQSWLPPLPWQAYIPTRPPSVWPSVSRQSWKKESL